MPESKPPPKDTSLEIDKALVDGTTIHKNLAQEILITTVDKVKLCLIEHQNVLKSQRDWIAPAGILATLLASLVAADFKNFLGIDVDFWKATFIILSVMAACWLIVTLFRAYRNRGKAEVDQIIRKLKDSPHQK